MIHWKRNFAGSYEAFGAKGTRYEIERLDERDYDRCPGEKARWILRVDGIPSDAESSLWLLKEYVNGYETR